MSPSGSMPNHRTRHDFKKAIEADDREVIASLLCDHAELRGGLDAPLFDWGQPALARARSVETARLLLDEGASLEGVARWWAPGFCVITGVDAGVGRFLAERGGAVEKGHHETAEALRALGGRSGRAAG